MKKIKIPNVRMKLALAVSVMLLILGILVIVGGVFLYLAADKALTDLKPVANSYIDSAISTLESASNSISAAQPSLTSASQLTVEARNALTGVVSTVTDVGNALNINILGWRPLGAAADYMLDFGSQMQGVVSEIQTIGTSLSDTNTQMETMKASLRGVQSNLENTRAQLPTYFNQAYQAILLVTIGIPAFLGLVLVLGAGAILSLRKEITKISDKIP